MKITNDTVVDIFNAFPLPVFVSNKDLEIIHFNDTAKILFENIVKAGSNKLCGKLFGCAYEHKSDNGCGTTKYCSDCVIRSMVEKLAEGEKEFRKLSHLQIMKNGYVEDITLLVSGKCIELQGEELVILTFENITELIDIRKKITICMHCKKIRYTEIEWQDAEEYFYKHSNLRFFNGICPKCIEEEYNHSK